jgi:hypothetical protein
MDIAFNLLGLFIIFVIFIVAYFVVAGFFARQTEQRFFRSLQEREREEE